MGNMDQIEHCSGPTWIIVELVIAEFEHGDRSDGSLVGSLLSIGMDTIWISVEYHNGYSIDGHVYCYGQYGSD